MTYNQQAFDVKLEWGLCGIEALAAVSDVVVIVDVLSFSTCVDIATGNGATVYPYRWKDETVIAYAKSLGAEPADFRRKYTGGYSLSPASLTNIKAGTKLVLPSPNGSALVCRQSRYRPCAAACEMRRPLRNLPERSAKEFR